MMLSCLVFQCYISTSDYTTTQILLCKTKQLKIVSGKTTRVSKSFQLQLLIKSTLTLSIPWQNAQFQHLTKKSLANIYICIEQTTKSLSRIRAFEAFNDIIKTATELHWCSNFSLGVSIRYWDFSGMGLYAPACSFSSIVALPVWRIRLHLWYWAPGIIPFPPPQKALHCNSDVKQKYYL